MLTVEHHRVDAPGVRLHVAAAGEGPAVLAVHRWPQTWREWRGLMERLGDQYPIIAPDLRGCGNSGKPYEGYDALSIADDLRAVLDHFEVDSTHVIGHDIGGAPAYALCARHPESVRSLALLQAPLWGVVSEDVPDLPDLFWHLKFHQDVDLATALITGWEEMYLRHSYRGFAFNPTAIGEDDIAAYVAAYAAPGGLRASLEHYRAIPTSADQLTRLTKTKLRIPVLALGGSEVMRDYVLNAATLIAEAASGGVVERCGHWVADEHPDFIASQLEAHFEAAQDASEIYCP